MNADEPQPQPGQIWRRLDPRDGGLTVEVQHVGIDYVIVRAVRRSRIARRNFTRQYAFVSGPPS